MDFDLGHAIGGIGAGILGGLFGSMQQQQLMGFNAAQASDQRNWEKGMSDTAHQREVKDLEAANLNPILSGMGGSGASTPSGASATAPTGSNPLEMAMNAAKMSQELKLIGAQVETTKSQGTAAETQAYKNFNEAEKAKSEKQALDLDNTGSRGFWNRVYGGFNSAADAANSYKLKDLGGWLSRGVKDAPINNSKLKDSDNWRMK